MRQKLAVNRIERLYNSFVMKNKEKIQKIIGSGPKEEVKNDNGESFKAEIKPSPAELVEKTPLNTMIRFNVVDPLGFDDASLAMY